MIARRHSEARGSASRMNEPGGSKALRFTLRIISVVMVGAGSVTVLLGG